jgi:hypothetical protein
MACLLLAPGPSATFSNAADIEEEGLDLHSVRCGIAA